MLDENKNGQRMNFRYEYIKIPSLYICIGLWYVPIGRVFVIFRTVNCFYIYACCRVNFNWWQNRASKPRIFVWFLCPWEDQAARIWAYAKWFFVRTLTWQALLCVVHLIYLHLHGICIWRLLLIWARRASITNESRGSTRLNGSIMLEFHLLVFSWRS